MEDKEQKVYSPTELDGMDADIIVVSGYNWAVAIASSLRPMTLANYSCDTKGLLCNPEGFVMAFPNEGERKVESNSPLDLVSNCDQLVLEGFSGIILTNSSFVVEAVDLYSKMYGRSARFFLADDDPCKLVDCTSNMEAVYRSFTKGIDMLDDCKHELETSNEKITEEVCGMVEEFISKNPRAAGRLVYEVKKVLDKIPADGKGSEGGAR